MEVNLVRIVPAKTGSSDAMGTEVFVGDQKMTVNAITLRASAQTGRWTALIECEAILDGEIVAEILGGA